MVELAEIQNFIIVIPARLHSTRLPGKVLADIAGKPMLWHVWSRACSAVGSRQVWVATDTPQIVAAVEGWGGKAILTSPECRSGTERIASVLHLLDGEFILDVQGDEPLIDPRLLQEMAQRWQVEPVDLLTPVYRITESADLANPNVVKVARAQDGRALYFSRSPIPYQRQQPFECWPSAAACWGHVGVYGFRRRVLEQYPSLPESPLEAAERLEQLRFLEAGYAIHTIETAYRPIAVDTAEDLERVRRIFAAQANSPERGEPT